jgi:anti-sigma factor RsiW
MKDESPKRQDAKRQEMTCGSVREQLALLLYGELTFDQEECVDSHLDGCAECRAALERERAMHAVLDSAAMDPQPSLLRECREDLRVRLMEEPAQPATTRLGWWDRAIDALTFRHDPGSLRAPGGFLRPAGALTLVAIGFGIAQLVPSFSSNGGFRTGLGAMSLADAGAARVRYVEPAADGRVQIVLDETRERIVSGRVDDQKIRALLLTAAKDPDAGLRAKSVDILTSRAQSADILDALVYAVQNDQNAGVRMKAMEGLKPFVGQPEVRDALEQVLFSDANPGLRTQAIDLLTGGDNASIDRNVDREIVGALQELIERGEQQGYVRERCRSVLRAVNASLETY